MSKKLLVSLLAVALLSVTLFGCGRKPKAAPAPSAMSATPVMVMKAVQGPIHDTVLLTGTAHGNQEADIYPELAGAVSAVFVDVGAKVRRGQALVRLDTQLVQAQAGQAAAAVNAAEAQRRQATQGVALTDAQTAIGVKQAQEGLQVSQQRLAQAQRSRELIRAQVNSNSEQADLALKHAQSALRDIRTGAREQELASAVQAVEQAKSALQLAQANYNRQLSLFQSGAVAKAQLEAAQTDMDVSASRVRQAESALSLTRAGARTEQVTAAELSVAQAEQAVALARRGGTEQLAISDRDVEAASLAVGQAKQGVRLAQEGRRQVAVQREGAQAAAAGVRSASAAANLLHVQAGKHIIYSPIDGVVSLRLVEPGVSAGTATTLMRIVTLDPIKVNCTVSELDRAKLNVGQSATVRVDGLGDRTFVGRVVDIAPEAVQGSRNFVARVLVANRDGALKPGMFCRIEVEIGFRDRATMVSRDCVVEAGSQRLAYVVENGQIKIRQVKLGASTDSMVEVLSGVKPGDTLVATGQSLLAEGQAVRPVVRSAATGPAAGQ